MKSIQTLLFLCLLSLGMHALAQNPNLDFKWGLKIGAELTYSSLGPAFFSNQPTVASPPQYTATVLQTAPSLLWRGKSAFLLNEVSVSGLRIRRLQFVDDRNGQAPVFKTQSEFGLGLKYGKFFAFMHKRDHKIVPMIGAEFAVGISASKSSPVVLQEPFRQSRIGATAYLTPRVAWFPTKRLFFDLSWQIQAYYVDFIHRERVVVDNSIAQKFTVNRFVRDHFRYPYLARLSVGLKI